MLVSVRCVVYASLCEVDASLCVVYGSVCEVCVYASL